MPEAAINFRKSRLDTLGLPLLQSPLPLFPRFAEYDSPPYLVVIRKFVDVII